MRLRAAQSDLLLFALLDAALFSDALAADVLRSFLDLFSVVADPELPESAAFVSDSRGSFAMVLSLAT